MYKRFCKRALKIFFVIVFSYSFRSCRICDSPLYEYPPDWKNVNLRDSVIRHYSSYLMGKRIFLDPGHGGEDRKNRNKDGTIIEADVNLKVAIFLKEYLRKAGVEVIMSREDDITVPLNVRSELANNSKADLFISIHHNAPAKLEDEYTNYTSVYYHAKEGDYKYEPFERDLARYIQRDLSYVMGNPGGLGSFDGTYSDYDIYPKEGFSVLRKTKIPAILVECAFHTSRLEALRLNDETFNRIQAWGIFRGLGKFFKSGFPEILILQDSILVNNGNLKISFLLQDSIGIDIKSIKVFLDKEEKNFLYNKLSNIITINLELNNKKEHIIRIICANKIDKHSFPFHKKIIINQNNEIKILDP